MLRLALILMALAAALAVPAAAKVNVVASTPELGSIAKMIGGANVSVVSLARVNQDYHKVEARPSDVTQVSRADLLIRIGMDLDLWVDALIRAARNSRVSEGGRGYVDASAMIRRMDVPSERVTGASGDIHAQGNPHFWLDPGNAKVIAYQILLGLRRVDAKNASSYDAAYKKFTAEIERRMKGWKDTLAPFRGRSVVAYHDEWVYFCQRFGLKEFGFLEPKPGIPPSGGHISSLISRMKQGKAKSIIVPSIYPMKFPEMVAKETGAKIARVPYSVGSVGTKDYFGYMDAIVNGIARALK